MLLKPIVVLLLINLNRHISIVQCFPIIEYFSEYAQTRLYFIIENERKCSKHFTLLYIKINSNKSNNTKFDSMCVI